MRVECILFDAMGVIFPVGDDTNDILVPFVQARNPDITSEEINALYSDASLGLISPETFWWKCRIPGAAPEALEESYLSSFPAPDKAFFPLAETLRQSGFRLAMLSNDIGPWSAYLRKKSGLDALLECSVISGDVGIRKPDAGIYQYALEKLACRPEACLFIDDRMKNLLPAREMGIQVLRFAWESGLPDMGSGIPSISRLGDLPAVLRDLSESL
ncbi:HAD family hydrolase [Papillibacter cinnamivorans]|uniref:Haloacid dehalogenase-like hydrolase n=1 Tax=Papillibacter cinnamivorans DSM 12816 TaxID=1122930 RepID=A0A1W2CM54_9FIRM|nr:HAD-IA family hydrolase [Papillibacter cinnamivorans]SMC85718.1 Haloacid dehalogenase-like hydrolase [Papillibacter cinnamivorans DSM 12816]